jgi:CDP-diacylglycerol--serine O-phosphatidyltransferase
MLSDLAFMSLKFKDFTLKKNLSKIILLLIGIIAFIFLQWLAVPVIFIAYILISLMTTQKLFK